MVPGGAPSGARVGVANLILTDFRSYASARIAPGLDNVVLTGANGAGKTNMLEAVSFLAPGRGLRGARLSEVARRDIDAAADAPSRQWAVAGRLECAGEIADVGTGLDPDALRDGRERRIVRVDGETQKSQASLAEHLAVVWLTPQMDGLFIEGPGGRRRFLDRLVYAADPAHAGRVSAYEQAMRERARLLQEQGAGADAKWLSALEATMAEKGIAVAAARREMLGRLAGFLDGDQGPFPSAEVTLAGGPEGWLDEGPALAAEDRFRQHLAAGRMGDAADGRTNVGPHRTDMRVRHAEKRREAEFCSTGEQKALLIALVLAHARMQAAEASRRPVLLLDELAAHLDAERRRHLFDILCGLDTQVWMTGTDAQLFDGMRGRARFFRVADAHVAEDR